MGKARERVFEERKGLVEKVIEDLKNNKVPFWRKGWNTPLPKNITSNKFYQGLNLIKLNLSTEKNGFKDSRWVTFKQATQKNYKVKKGSSGTRIEFWGWEITKKIKDKNGNTIETKEELENPIVKYYYVYNADQIENLPENEKDMSFFRKNDLIESIIKNSESPVTFCASNRAYYSPTADSINIPNREFFKSENEFYHTVLHEIAHSTGHESRLNRNLKGEKFDKEYAIEELTAELTSMFLQQQLGIEIIGDEALFDNHKAYLKGYVEILEETPNILFKIIREAEKATDYVMNLAKN